MRHLPILLLASCIAEPLSAPPPGYSDEATPACHQDWSDCERSDGVCPAHGIAYECDDCVSIPEHCERVANMVCCEYLPPPLDLPVPPGIKACTRLDDPHHQLCPTGIAYACRCLPPHCQWAGDGVACCMPLI